MRGQVGIEVILIIGFAVLLLIPLVLGVWVQMTHFTEQIAVNQADETAGRIAKYADIVGAQWPNATAIIRVNMPAFVNETVVGSRAVGGTGREIVVVMRTSAGNTEIVKTTSVNVTGSLQSITAPGTYEVKLTAQEGPTPMVRVEPA